MKLAHPQIEKVFDTEKDAIQTIIIENPGFMYKLLLDLTQQIEGLEGETIVSIRNEPVSICKYVEIIDRFVPFNLNKKALLNKISAALEKNAMEAAHFQETAELLKDIELYLDKIAFDFPCDIVFNKINIASLIKSSALELRDDYKSLAEKVFDYMELVQEFEDTKLFITLNMRDFISDDEMELFGRTVLAHAYHLIMIEGAEHPKLSMEERLIIDSDLCEIG